VGQTDIRVGAQDDSLDSVEGVENREVSVSIYVPACVLAAALAAGVACAEPPALRWDIVSSNEFALKLGGRDVWRFHADPSKSSKPYFDPVTVAGGPSLTWARPPDHPWHYGLWFSWKYINGVNYWEEDKGQPSGKTGWSVSKVETQPDGCARIELALDYRPAAGAEPVLREQRTISLSAPDSAGSYTVDWTLVFTAGGQSVALDRTPLPGEPGGQSWGGYAGLSIRFARAITNVETVASTVGRVSRNAAGRLDVTAAAAEQNGVVDGRPYGIAILSHPSNPRTPGDWYPIEGKSFTYLNAAFLLKSAYTLKSGETLTLRYRVQVHPGRWDAEDLRQAAKRYVADTAVAVTDKMRVLLLTGANNHNWQETTAALTNLFAQDPRFTVAVNDRPWEMKPADVQGYDLVFSNWNTFGKRDEEKRTFEWDEATRAAFLEWVRNGGGLFVLHSGGCLFYDWVAFQSLTGGAWEKETFHPKMQTFRVNLADKAHPVTRGMADFETFDEPWQHIGNRNPSRHVLATGVVAKENGGSGEPEPFAFVTELGKGRCFNLVLGHNAQALGNAGCRTLILRGAEWAATGSVK